MTDIKQFLNSKPPKNGRFYTIAIDGRGGCGKTVFTEYLGTLLPDFIFINGDDYFEPVSNRIVWGSFNDKRFKEDVVEPLKASSKFLYRAYDWHSKPHITETAVAVDKGFGLERNYSFLFDLNWDLKIWIETPKAICLERGIAREHMSKERVMKAWQVWQTTEDNYIKKIKPLKTADIVIDGTKPFKDQIA